MASSPIRSVRPGLVPSTTQTPSEQKLLLWPERTDAAMQWRSPAVFLSVTQFWPHALRFRVRLAYSLPSSL